MNPFQDQPIKYVDFGQLTRYLDYLPSKRAERIKQNSKDDAKAGRIPNYMNYVMPFTVAEYQKGFFLLAEAYTPGFQSVAPITPILIITIHTIALTVILLMDFIIRD